MGFKCYIILKSTEISRILNPKLHLNAASCVKCSRDVSDVKYCVCGLRFQIYFCQKVSMLVFTLSSKNIFFFLFSSTTNIHLLAVPTNWPSLCSDIPCHIKLWMSFWWVPVQHLTKFVLFFFTLFLFCTLSFFSKFSNKRHPRYTVTAVIILSFLHEQKKITNQWNNVKKKDMWTFNRYIKSTMWWHTISISWQRFSLWYTSVILPINTSMLRS